MLIFRRNKMANESTVIFQNDFFDIKIVITYINSNVEEFTGITLLRVETLGDTAFLIVTTEQREVYVNLSKVYSFALIKKD